MRRYSQTIRGCCCSRLSSRAVSLMSGSELRSESLSGGQPAYRSKSRLKSQWKSQWNSRSRFLAEFSPKFSAFLRFESPEAGGVDHTGCARARAETRRSCTHDDTGKRQSETPNRRRRTRVCKSDHDSNSGSSRRRIRCRRASERDLAAALRGDSVRAAISVLLEHSRFFSNSRKFSAACRKAQACHRAIPPNGIAEPLRVVRNVSSGRRFRAVPASPRPADRASGTVR
jgi:hypothetical protein